MVVVAVVPVIVVQVALVVLVVVPVIQVVITVGHSAAQDKVTEVVLVVITALKMV